jgi:hypothetical protein
LFLGEYRPVNEMQMTKDIWIACRDDVECSRLAELGFRLGEKGTHSSRTMMLDDLSTVLLHCPKDAQRRHYATEIVDNNILGKRTASMRRSTNQRLGELYALDPAVLLFRVFRLLWESDAQGRPILALLLALARDPLLRATIRPVIDLEEGRELLKGDVLAALQDAVGHRLNESSLDKVTRNTRSTWCQSGHLEGRVRKIRRRVSPTPYVTTYALLLAYLVGARGQALFESPCVRVLDTSSDDLMHLAMDAKRLGIIDLQKAGGLLYVSFDLLLTAEERGLAHGTH